MPDLKSFEVGFGLIRGKEYAGYLLKDIEGVHQAIIKYKEYHYHLTLTYKLLNTQMSEKDFYDNHIFEDREILTHYGNPYMCKLWKINYEEIVDHQTGDKELIVRLEGEANKM